VTEQFGEIKNVAILKDRHTGLSRCAAFVTFLTKPAADAAVAHFANPVTLPGAYAPLEVSFNMISIIIRLTLNSLALLYRKIFRFPLCTRPIEMQFALGHWTQLFYLQTRPH
jgi:RNA recognition motif. (a.k.a. RRM, RBD, or RNP domain)